MRFDRTISYAKSFVSSKSCGLSVFFPSCPVYPIKMILLIWHLHFNWAARLVLALGAESKLDVVPGSAEYALPFSTLVDAYVSSCVSEAC